MRYKNKEEVMKAYKEGKLAKWELKPILEHIEFCENLSEIGKIVFKCEEKDENRY